MLSASLIFNKTEQSKLSANGQNFAQSDHPDAKLQFRKFYQIGAESKVRKILFALQIKKCRQSVPAHDEQMLQNTF
jgi:hypothetical protein